jgi:long-subunit acyl-CoA synthetase (AMP-forming)
MQKTAKFFVKDPMMMGYYKDEKLTSEVITDGFSTQETEFF